MKRNLLIFILAIVIGLIGIALVLANDNTLVFHPKGIIAQREFELILKHVGLMLLIIVPTYILLFAIVWKYCIKKENTKYDPQYSYGPLGELMMWGLPALIVIAMVIVTWNATHQLNPYKPIESEEKPLQVQVIALNWKWLFIYPELGIATLNALHIPERTPIHLRLTTDRAPMNSFWVPQLSGQIYAMPGMTTQLFIMADNPGEYVGRAVEINGEGYADMTFLVKSMDRKDFEEWITQAKKSTQHLTKDAYQQLSEPEINKAMLIFSDVEKDLYHQVVNKYMFPKEPVL